MSYKRNQIEEAIARTFDPNCQEPPSELRTRIKRLLELDRSIGRKRRSKDAEEANFAFFSEEAPGTGADILFSEYEAFALLNALRIMEHGWPQGFAVSIMRRVRPDLEKEHARILWQDPVKLFDLQAIRASARPGDIAVDNTDPVFLTLASKTLRSPDDEQTPPLCAVCHGSEKVGEFSRDVVASTLTMLEIATIVHYRSARPREDSGVHPDDIGRCASIAAVPKKERRPLFREPRAPVRLRRAAGRGLLARG